MVSKLLGLLALAAPALGHMAIWHPAVFGFEGENGPNGDNWDAHDIANPLSGRPKDGPDGWWFHGKVDDPPVEGAFVELVAGGHLNAQLACNRHFSTWGNPDGGYGAVTSACDAHGMLHTQDAAGARELRDVKGCAIAIGYASDPALLQPEEMVVVSVDYQCPWHRAARFAIPAGLPPCPAAGCLCTWNWVHSARGGQAEIVHSGFRCNVSGSTGTAPLPRNPKVANKCPHDRSNCTTGAKTPFVWAQAQGNNVHQDAVDPPAYNWEYGFGDGAQDDVFTVDAGSYTNTEWAVIPWNTPDGPVPDVTPATKAGVPPVRTALSVTPPPFHAGPGTSAPPNGPATREWTGAAPQPTAESGAASSGTASGSGSNASSAVSAPASSSSTTSTSPGAAKLPAVQKHKARDEHGTPVQEKPKTCKRKHRRRQRLQ